MVSSSPARGAPYNPSLRVQELDRRIAELASHHAAVLEAAAQKHENVRKEAEIILDTLFLEQQNEAQKASIQQSQALREAQKARLELIALEHQERLQAERHALLEAETRSNLVKQQREFEEAQARRLKEAQERHQEEIALAAKNVPATSPAVITKPNLPPPVSAPAPIQAPTTDTQAAPITPARTSDPLMQWPQLEAQHEQYMQLHSKLKKLRANVETQYSKIKPKYETIRDARGNKTDRLVAGDPKHPLCQMNEQRRDLSKLLGQTTDDKAKNKSIRTKIEQIFSAAWNNTAIAVDARDYIIRPTCAWPANANFQVSGAFLYLLNKLIKSAIQTMRAGSQQTAYNALDYIGVILSWIVSKSQFRMHGNSFADVIFAKYHSACPPLFGVYGSEKTTQGRAKLGWKIGMKQQEHFDNINALAIGWGAMTLRDYTRLASEENAIPAWHYWQSMACVVNVPPEQLTKTHGIIIKGLIDSYAGLFVKFYGQAAIAVLRRVMDLPKHAPADAGFEKVEVLRDNLSRTYGLRI